MTTKHRCPHCGWPTDELPTSAHRTSEGIVDYRRCVCGAWLVQINGCTVAAK